MNDTAEIEASVLGTLLAAPSAFSEVSEYLDSGDFYDSANACLYAAMTYLDSKQSPIDVITVWDRVVRSGDESKFNQVMGSKYLTELLCQAVTVSNVVYHARLLAKKARRRAYIRLALEIRARGADETQGDDEFFASVESDLLHITQTGKKTAGKKLVSVLRSVSSSLGKRYEAKGAITGIPSGFLEYDSMSGGFQPSELTIWAARPSMGKTSLAENAVRQAASQGHPCLFFSLEMSAEALAERGMAGQGRIDSQVLKRGNMQTSDWAKITRAASVMSDLPIWIDDSGGLTIADIRSRSRRWRMTDGKSEKPAIICVDYLQLVSAGKSDNRSRNREQEISEISRNLKALAKELQCPVIALSQLNRGLESRADKRPMMSDLRESGAIEQDADVIAFIYRDEVYSKDQCKPEDIGVAEIIIAKHRNGPTGTLRLKWDGKYTAFSNLEQKRAAVEYTGGGMPWVEDD